MNIIKNLYYKLHKLRLKFEERTSADGAKYLFDDHKSDKLIVILSGMQGTYNYRKTLSRAKGYDQLYIKDCWAKGVSYYLFENGSNLPEVFTSRIIEDILARKKYKKVYFAGSSKGGASVLYFGLKHHADIVFSGVGQYRLGDYLGVYHNIKKPEYLNDVSGNANRAEWIEILNKKMESVVDENKNSDTIIYLMYSKLEHTYPEHTVYLIKKLDECNIQHVDIEEHFTDHWACGDYFKQLLVKKFIKDGI